MCAIELIPANLRLPARYRKNNHKETKGKKLDGFAAVEEAWKGGGGSPLETSSNVLYNWLLITI